jgi:hypothetical protein
MSDRALRQVALKLHALHAHDKAWILGQLAYEVRKGISVLLNELKALGIQSLPEAVVHSGFPTSNTPLDAELVREIDHFGGELVFALLDDLPLRQKALVFHAHPWRWTTVLWNRLADGERQRLAKAMEMLNPVRPPVILSVLASFRALGRERQGGRISAIRG